MAPLSPEHGSQALSTVEAQKLIVHQPKQLAELGKLLETFENLNARVGERAGEDTSGDLGGAGAGAGQGDDGTYVSPRDVAIQNIPAQAVMQQELVRHIEAEVRHLETMTRSLKHAARPGVAYRLNDLYARIRRLNSLLGEILEASVDMLKRLFIRVFIDKQSVI